MGTNFLRANFSCFKKKKKSHFPSSASSPFPPPCLKSLVWLCYCCSHKHIIIIIRFILTHPQEAENHSHVIFADGCDVPLPQAFGPSQQCQTGRGKEWYSPHWDAAASPHQSLPSTGIANPFPLIPLEAFRHLEYYLKCQTVLSASISLNIWDFNCSELLTVTGSEEPTHNLSLQGEGQAAAALH